MSCRVVQYIKVDAVSFALRFRKNAVLLFCLSLYGCVVLRHAFQHIMTLSYVNDGIVNLDAVNARMVVFFSIPFPFQPFIHVFSIPHQNTNPVFSGFGVSGFFGSNFGTGILTSFTSGIFTSVSLFKSLLFVLDLVVVAVLFISISSAVIV